VNEYYRSASASGISWDPQFWRVSAAPVGAVCSSVANGSWWRRRIRTSARRATRAGAGVTTAMTTRPTDRRTDGRTDVEVTTVTLKTTSRVLDHLDGVHVGATWGIRSNDSCTSAIARQTDGQTDGCGSEDNYTKRRRQSAPRVAAVACSGSNSIASICCGFVELLRLQWIDNKSTTKPQQVHNKSQAYNKSETSDCAGSNWHQQVRNNNSTNPQQVHKKSTTIMEVMEIGPNSAPRQTHNFIRIWNPRLRRLQMNVKHT